MIILTDEEMIVRDTTSQGGITPTKKDAKITFLFMLFSIEAINRDYVWTQLQNLLAITHEFSDWIAS